MKKVLAGIALTLALLAIAHTTVAFFKWLELETAIGLTVQLVASVGLRAYVALGASTEFGTKALRPYVLGISIMLPICLYVIGFILEWMHRPYDLGLCILMWVSFLANVLSVLFVEGLLTVATKLLCR
ncbi:MAG: hypothetical protein IPJ76_05480 [Flavobacteriales bacterium]|nr:MAG: hypothetical protein IPJ76_05480 [Flavobacteriales bacterium]